MAGEILLTTVGIATLCIDSCLYGVMMVLFSLSTYLLLARRTPMSDQREDCKMEKLRRVLLNPFISSSVFVAMCATAQWLLISIRTFMAFVTYHDGNSPTAFFSDLRQPTQVACSAFVVLASLVSDSMCIYRTWAIWGYNKTVIILPLFTLIGLAVGGIGITVQLSQFVPTDILFASSYSRWIYCDTYFSLCTNLYTTTAIIWKILSMNRDLRGLRSTYKQASALGIVVESALLYTAWVIFVTVSYQVKSNMQNLAINNIPAVAGIAFMLINIRIGLGWAQRSFVTSNNAPPSSLKSHHAFMPEAEAEYAMRPLAIQVQREVRTDVAIDFNSTGSHSQIKGSNGNSF